MRWLLAALLLLVTACAGRSITGPGSRQSIVLFSHQSFLGDPPTVDQLAYGFLVKDEPQLLGFGYYVYLVFRPEASQEQRRAAAQALLAYQDRREFRDEVERSRLALLGVPVRHPRVPKDAQGLVGDYDRSRADIITLAVERAGASVPTVALIAYPEPIERGTKLEVENLLVTDVCGSPQQVGIKFRRLREALVRGRRDGVVLKVAEVIGRFFLTASTLPCQ